MSDVAIVVQARLGSTRLPGKSLRLAGGRPLIDWVLSRLAEANLPLVLAVPEGDAEAFRPWARRAGALLVAGSEVDVLGRYALAARACGARTIIRATGDNPSVSIPALRKTLDEFDLHLPDLAHPVDLPYGAGVEVLSAQALFTAQDEARDAHEREHVTPYLYRHPERFRVRRVEPPEGERRPRKRVTVDTFDDFRRFVARL